MSDTIEQSISNYNKVIDDAVEQLKVIHSKYVCANPEDLRKYYDRTREIIKKKTNEINERKHYINECINNLEKCKNSIAEMEKVIEEISKTSNSGRVGTLHGLCRQTIKEHEISMDEIEEMVSNFPYDEQNEIKKYKEQNDKSIGGKNKFSKRNNTKRKKYRAKNGNNKSKQRRFK
jgi:hypothetical protein